MLSCIILHSCVCFITELTAWKLLTVIKMESKAHHSSPVKDQLKVWFKDYKKLSGIPRFMEQHTWYPTSLFDPAVSENHYII